MDFTFGQIKPFSIDLCKKEKAQFILRGLRNPADFEFEKAIAHTNRRLSKIETVFLNINICYNRLLITTN